MPRVTWCVLVLIELEENVHVHKTSSSIANLHAQKILDVETHYLLLFPNLSPNAYQRLPNAILVIYTTYLNLYSRKNDFFNTSAETYRVTPSLAADLKSATLPIAVKTMLL